MSIDEIRLEEADRRDPGPWEWGHYLERHDGDEWTPLIYEVESEDAAREFHERMRVDREPFRNSRVVRRAVSPWEVQA